MASQPWLTLIPIVNLLSDEGLIIKLIKYGEGHKIAHILTREHGLIRAMAKGAGKTTSKKSAHLDQANLIKFTATKSQDYFFLSQVDSLNSFTAIKSDLLTMRTCFYILEILNFVLAEEQADEPLFHSLKNYLENLDKTAPANNRIQNVRFQLYLIDHLGFKKADDITPKGLINYFENLIDRRLKTPQILLRHCEDPR